MGTPAPDILQQMNENNFTGTATLSVLDGEGIFGGKYKQVYYFYKKPETFISSTNVVTLNLFGIPDKKNLDKFLAIINKKTTPKPGKPGKPKPTKPTKPPKPTKPFGFNRDNEFEIRTRYDESAVARGKLLSKFKKGFGQFFLLEWEFLDERQIRDNTNTVIDPNVSTALDSVVPVVVPSLVQIVNGLRLVINRDLLNV